MSVHENIKNYINRRKRCYLPILDVFIIWCRKMPVSYKNVENTVNTKRRTVWVIPTWLLTGIRMCLFRDLPLLHFRVYLLCVISYFSRKISDNRLYNYLFFVLFCMSNRIIKQLGYVGYAWDTFHFCYRIHGCDVTALFFLSWIRWIQ